MSAVERHYRAAERRRAMMDRARERGAASEVLAEHSRKLDRLERLWMRARQADVTRDLDAGRQRRGVRVQADRAAEMARVSGRRPTALAHAAGETGTARDRRDVALVDMPVPGDPRARREVLVNRRVDTLAHERAQKRISHDEFFTGRKLQAVWEGQDGSHVSGADWSGGSRRSGITDGLSASEVLAIRRLVGARDAETLNAELVPVIGRAGLQELRAVLCGHGYFADMAMAESGSAGRYAVADIAGRFRWLLRQVTRAMDGGADGAAPIRGWAAG